MFSTLRKQLGTAGLIVSVIALVFAMGGGAWAAKDNLGGDATASAKKKGKSKRGPRGKRGKRGARGPQGPVGAQGPIGPAGPAGADGKIGVDGEEGVPGIQGPTGPAGADGATGPAGADGATGPEGSPWTELGTLPSGETLQGAWAVGNYEMEKSVPMGTTVWARIPISFTIPLAASLDSTHVKVIAALGTPPAECDDGVAPAAGVSNPEADPGYLCAYVQKYVGFAEAASFRKLVKPGSGNKGAEPSGAILSIGSPAGSGLVQVEGFGSWAVTAP